MSFALMSFIVTFCLVIFAASILVSIVNSGKAVKQNSEETKSSAEKTTSNEKLNWIQTKLQQVITKLGSIKNGAKSYYHILHTKLLEILQFILGKTTPKEKLKFVENNLQGVLTTVEDIKSEANASENLPSHNLNADAAEIATDAAKIVEILNDSLKTNEQQGIDGGKGKSIGEKKGITEAEKDTTKEQLKFVEEKAKEVITTHGAQPYHKKGTPKQKLIFVQEKLNEVTTALGDIKTEASAIENLPRYISLTLLSPGIITHCHNALKYAGLLSKTVEAALQVEEKAIGITNLNNLAGELRGTIKNIGNFTFHANDPEKAKNLQQSAFRAVGEISKTLKDLEADLSDLNDSLKTNEQQGIGGGKGITEAEKNTPKQKLKFVKEKLNEVTTTLEAIKTKASPSDNLSRHITLTLKYAGLLSKALEAAFQVEEKSIDIKNLRNFAGELQETIKNIGNNTGHGKHSEKAKTLQESALSAAGEIIATLKDLEADLSKH